MFSRLFGMEIISHGLFQNPSRTAHRLRLAKKAVIKIKRRRNRRFMHNPLFDERPVPSK